MQDWKALNESLHLTSDYWVEEPSLKQRLFLMSPQREVLFGGAAGGGKSSALLMATLQYPLAVDTEVPTTVGWKTIGSLTPGDRVFGIDGKPVTVIDKTAVEFVESSELQFRNGTSIVASNDHLWAMHDFTDRMAITNPTYQTPPTRPLREVTTAQLVETLHTSHKRPKNNWSVPLPEPLIFEDVDDEDLPLDPYTLGLWLGDGTKSSGGIAVHADDDASSLLVAANTGLQCKRYDENRVHVAGLVTLLREAGVLNNKHIPETYMRSSLTARTELLRGLMDADGTVCRDGNGRFFQVDNALADQVAELARSLGTRVNTGTQKYVVESTGEHRTGHHVDIYASFPLFNLQRKRDAQKLYDRQRERMLWDVVPVGKKPVQCITVDNDDHLFLITRDLIPTHNCDIPGYSAILFRRTFSDLALPGALMDRFKDWVGAYPDVRSNETSYQATFPSGARVTFGYLNNTRDYERYRGSEYQFCGFDEASVPIRMEQEPGSAGKNLISQYSRFTFPGMDFQGTRATGDKETRAKPFSSAVANGNVKLLMAAWNTDFIDELTSFPEGQTHDDQVDAACHAFNHVAGLGGGLRKKVSIIV